AGVPYRGPLVLPGTYTLKLHLSNKVLTQDVEVKLDPRVKGAPSELADAHKLALQLRNDVTKLSTIVVALRSVRRQTKERIKLLDGHAKADAWIKQAKEVVAKLDALEEQLHNPKAEVTYD